MPTIICPKRRCRLAVQTNGLLLLIWQKLICIEKKYTEAKALFDQVIANGKTTNGKKYGLVANYSDVFNADNDNNAESVFAIQAAANTGSSDNANPDLDLNFPYNTGSNGPAGCCGFFAPSFDLANSFRVRCQKVTSIDRVTEKDQANGLYNSAANQLKNDQGIQSSAAFTPDRPG